VTFRAFSFDEDALADLREVWALIALKDGDDRADKLLAKIEAFCFRLAEVPQIGTRHDERLIGLRSTGVPGLRTANVLFRVTSDAVTIVRVGYLGRNVWQDIPA
jgi:plasmid stabilization system protein ParE